MKIPSTWPPTLHAQMGLSRNPLLICGACGRETNADMLYDVRPIPHLRVEDETHQCCSCLASHYRHSRLTHEAFARAHGAPAEHVQRAASHDAALQKHFRR
jgi:hypothetical protein